MPVLVRKRQAGFLVFDVFKLDETRVSRILLIDFYFIHSKFKYDYNKTKRNEVKSTEIRFLLTGGVVLQSFYPKPECEWLTEKIWSELVSYSNQMNGQSLLNHVKDNV